MAGRTYYGTNRAERIYGTADADRLYGNGGNDTIAGYGGLDTIDGGAGIDTQIMPWGSAGANIENVIVRGYSTSLEAGVLGNRLGNYMREPHDMLYQIREPGMSAMYHIRDPLPSEIAYR